MNSNDLTDIKSEYSSLHNLLVASYLPRIVNAAIHVGLFEALSKKSLGLESLVGQLGTDLELTESLCEVLVKIELLDKKDGCYGLTGCSREFLLGTSVVNQLGAVQKFTGSSGMFDNLLEALQGNKPEFDHKMWISKKMALSLAQGSKDGSLQNVQTFICNLPEFSSFHKMCDLAGNIGHYSQAIVSRSRQLAADVYDLPEVVEIAHEIHGPDVEGLDFYPFDIKQGDDFGSGYDLFFVSHFLYEYGFNGSLPEFFKRVNKALQPGGVFVSNHICSETPRQSELAMLLVELHTRCVGYPTHKLPREVLQDALQEAGFGDFTMQEPQAGQAYPTLLLAARKLQDC